jgi:hypothetical protein
MPLQQPTPLISWWGEEKAQKEPGHQPTGGGFSHVMTPATLLSLEEWLRVPSMLGTRWKASRGESWGLFSSAVPCAAHLMQLAVCGSHEHLVSIYYLSGTVLGTGERSVDKTSQTPAFLCVS